MTTARELLEAALAEAGALFAPVVVALVERTPSGAELLRRADEPRVAEGLTVEALRDALVASGIGAWDDEHVARILANIPAPRPPEPLLPDCACPDPRCDLDHSEVTRPPEPPDIRVTKGPGTFGPDATWTIRTDRTAALKDGWDALVAWLIDHCDEPTPQVWTDEDGETGDVWMWCEGHQVRGPRLGRSDPPVADGTVCEYLIQESDAYTRECGISERDHTGDHLSHPFTPTPPTPEATDAAE